MKLWPFGRGTVSMEPLFTDEELEGLPYTKEFNLSDQADLLRLSRIRDVVLRGGHFNIRKPTDKYPIQINQLDHFPVREEVWDIVRDTYGGGVYNVYSGTGALLKSYIFDGPSFYNPPDGTGRPIKKGKGNVKDRVMDSIGDDIIAAVQDNPTLRAQITEKVVADAFGIKPSNGKEEKDDWLDLEMRKEVEANPRYRKALLQRALKERGIKVKDVPDEEDEDTLTAFAEDFKRLKKLTAILAPESSNGGFGMEMLRTLRTMVESGQLDLRGMITGVQGVQKALPGAGQTTITEPVVDEQPPRNGVEGVPETRRPTEIISSAPASQPNPRMGEGIVASLNLGGVDLMQVFNKADWTAIASGVRGDAGKFMQEAYVQALDNEDDVYATLIYLFRDNPPEIVYGALAEARQRLEQGMVRSMVIAFKGKDAYDTITTTLAYLMSPPGQKWIEHASAAAKYLQQRITEEARQAAQRAAAPTVTIPTEVSPVESPTQTGALSGDPGGDGKDEEEGLL